MTDQNDMVPGDEAPPGTEGTGEDLCPACNGDGRADGAECPECAGTGRVVKGIGGA
jgi:DnaJ-class molecular chaperone